MPRPYGGENQPGTAASGEGQLAAAAGGERQQAATDDANQGSIAGYSGIIDGGQLATPSIHLDTTSTSDPWK